MLKILGAIFLIGSFGISGIEIYKDMEHKLNLAQDLKNGFSYIKTDIVVSSVVLAEVLKKGALFAGSGSFVFENCSQKMIDENKNFETAWEESIENITDSKLLNILSEVGKRLGKSSAEEEAQFLESIMEKLDIFEKSQEKKLSGEGKIIKKTGFILGIAFAILLF